MYVYIYIYIQDSDREIVSFNQKFMRRDYVKFVWKI